MLLDTAINFNAYFDHCVNDMQNVKRWTKIHRLYVSMHTGILANEKNYNNVSFDVTWDSKPYGAL